MRRPVPPAPQYAYAAIEAALAKGQEEGLPLEVQLDREHIEALGERAIAELPHDRASQRHRAAITVYYALGHIIEKQN